MFFILKIFLIIVFTAIFTVLLLDFINFSLKKLNKRMKLKKDTLLNVTFIVIMLTIMTIIFPMFDFLLKIARQ